MVLNPPDSTVITRQPQRKGAVRIRQRLRLTRARVLSGKALARSSAPSGGDSPALSPSRGCRYAPRRTIALISAPARIARSEWRRCDRPIGLALCVEARASPSMSERRSGARADAKSGHSSARGRPPLSVGGSEWVDDAATELAVDALGRGLARPWARARAGAAGAQCLQGSCRQSSIVRRPSSGKAATQEAVPARSFASAAVKPGAVSLAALGDRPPPLRWIASCGGEAGPRRAEAALRVRSARDVLEADAGDADGNRDRGCTRRSTWPPSRGSVPARATEIVWPRSSAGSRRSATTGSHSAVG